MDRRAADLMCEGLAGMANKEVRDYQASIGALRYKDLGSLNDTFCKPTKMFRCFFLSALEWGARSSNLAAPDQCLKTYRQMVQQLKQTSIQKFEDMRPSRLQRMRGWFSSGQARCIRERNARIDREIESIRQLASQLSVGENDGVALVAFWQEAQQTLTSGKSVDEQFKEIARKAQKLCAGASDEFRDEIDGIIREALSRVPGFETLSRDLRA